MADDELYLRPVFRLVVAPRLLGVFLRHFKEYFVVLFFCGRMHIDLLLMPLEATNSILWGVHDSLIQR